MSISVWCEHNQKLYHFKVRPSTVLDQVIHALLGVLAQEVPCVVRAVSDMQLLLLGDIQNPRKSMQQNCIWGPTRPVAVPGWGLVQTTAAMFVQRPLVPHCVSGHCLTESYIMHPTNSWQFLTFVKCVLPAELQTFSNLQQRQ